MGARRHAFCRLGHRTAAWLGAALAAVAACSATAGEIERSEQRIEAAGAQPVRVVVHSFDVQRMRVQVLPSTALLGNQRRRGSGVSVQAAAELPTVKKLMRHEMLLFNGGFSTTSTDRPAGLLIADGQAVTVPNYAVLRAQPDSDCPALRKERLRLSALLCVPTQGGLSVGPMDEDSIARCSQALQAGPMLLGSDGQPDVCPSTSERAYIRTAVCLRDSVAHVIVTLDPVTLHDLARWLATPRERQGLGCTSAINLSGDTSSGALYAPGAGKVPVVSGPAGFAQASFVLVTPRSALGWQGR
jgi:uncharacterized protein YigE (DUF2233 family)